MQTADFLKQIFPFDPADPTRHADNIRFAVVDNNNGQRFPGTLHWKTRQDVNHLAETGAMGLGFSLTGKDVYFTPHGFTRRDERVTKEDCVDLLDVAWVELDDGDIPPDTFSPPPSFVVNTSPNRYHLYWKLDQPYPAEEVERINYRLVYGHNLREDKGGWARTKWLRLPGAHSYKRDTAHPVTITDSHPERVYALNAFDDLPSAPEMLYVLEGMPDTPNLEVLPTKEDIMERYSIPLELNDLLTRVRSDRSSALWRIYHLCYAVGMSQEECFVLVHSTPNDKFHIEWRYSADEDLWKDIYRGFRMSHTPGDTPILKELRAMRVSSGTPVSERNRLIAQAIAKDLMRTGRIYFHDERREALYYDGRHIIPIDPTNSRWKTLLNLRYWVVDGEKEFRPVNANLIAIAEDQGERVVPHTTSYWDRTSKLLYIYNNAGKVYRLDGDKIEYVDNGADGVLFRDVSGAAPFEACPPPDADEDGTLTPTLDDTIFGLPNFDVGSGHHSRTQAMIMLRMWMYSLFFSEEMDARPHLIITGPTDSGKSLAFQAISELLSGPGATVSSIPSDVSTFQTLVSGAHHVFLDNVDTPNKWLEDALCEVATGIEFTRRMLYTTNESVTYRVKCNIGMTTRNNWFSRADVANRSVVLHVERRGLKTSPTVLLDAIRENRNELWYELLWDLNRIIVELNDYQPGRHTLRMAAYADFVLAACRALDIDVTGLLELIEGNQRESALANSIIWSVLDPWIRATVNDPATNTPRLKNSGQRVTASRLHSELRRIADDMGCTREYERAIPSARALTHQLKELIPDIERFVRVEYIMASPANYYVFTVPESPAPHP